MSIGSINTVKPIIKKCNREGFSFIKSQKPPQSLSTQTNRASKFRSPKAISRHPARTATKQKIIRERRSRIQADFRDRVGSTSPAGDLRDGVGGHLVSVRVHVLDLAVVRPLVRDVERRRDGAAVRVLAPVLEEVDVELAIQVVNGVVEGQQDDLRRVLGGNATCEGRRGRGCARARRSVPSDVSTRTEHVPVSGGRARPCEISVLRLRLVGMSIGSFGKGGGGVQVGLAGDQRCLA